MKKIKKVSLQLFFLIFVVGCGGSENKINSFELHSWGLYHWETVSLPVSLNLGNNFDSNWTYLLYMISNDWNVSTVIQTNVVGGTSNRNCKATDGKIEICNGQYGMNGWLGIASIWVNSTNHIVKATTKLNDSYFDLPQYSGESWKRFVLCQEVGHNFGLSHQDEDFDNPNLGSCMDYTRFPESNVSPNEHDYDQLMLIYNHTETPNEESGDEGEGCFPPNSRRCGAIEERLTRVDHVVLAF